MKAPTRSILSPMRALPGRASRSSLPTGVTRANVKEDQRRRILRAIGELVAERGYADVTVELIVKRARVSFKTFYKHFPGKEECFLDLFETVDRDAREGRPRRASPPRPGPWPDQVAARPAHALIELIVAEPVIARA